ncbi:MAG: M48 family metallopeptidase [Alphaproteobacteria bacterium]|nr:M48 family metallopeptidase [Alphaproteobacteria bacterium]
MAHWLAPLIPIAWEESAGRHIAEAVFGATHTTSGQAKRICTTAAGTAALGRLTDRLSRVADSPYTFRIQVTPHPAVNALALPGGYAVIFSGLLDFAETPDEVAGVLAHEMAHVIHRHATTAVLRELGYALLFDLLSGGMAGGVVSVGHELLSLSYSRDAEADADATGLKLLERAGIGAHGFVAFWDRMRIREREGKDSAIKPPALLSTHLDSEARAALARSAPPTGTPALTAEEWRALKTICAG